MTLVQESPNSPPKSTPTTVAVTISVLTHLLLFAPVIYIIVLSAKNYNLFAWHPILTSIGIGLLTLEATFCLSGEAYVSSRITRKNRVFIHWLLQSFGFGLMLSGVIIVIVIKGNRPHFKSIHGKLGLSGVVFCAVMMLVGILANNTKWLYPRVSPIIIKIIHAVSGIIVTIILIATLINGTYTHWWRGSVLGRNLIFASFVVGTTFVMIKPILGAISRCKLMFKRKQPSQM